MLARDPGFVDVVAELVAPTGVALFATTPPGPLLARITAIEEHGVEGFAKRISRDPARQDSFAHRMAPSSVSAAGSPASRAYRGTGRRSRSD